MEDNESYYDEAKQGITFNDEHSLPSSSIPISHKPKRKFSKKKSKSLKSILKQKRTRSKSSKPIKSEKSEKTEKSEKKIPVVTCCINDKNKPSTLIALNNNHFKCFKNILDSGIKCDKHTTTECIELKKFKYLKCAVEHGCTIDKNTSFSSIRNGDLKSLKYLIEHKCPTNENKICDLAAEYGQIKILQHLHKSNYPMSKSIMYYACKGGSLQCVKYVYKCGIPFDKKSFEVANSNSFNDIVSFINSKT